MLYEKYTPRRYSPVWIIWFAMFIPDGDWIFEYSWELFLPAKIPLVSHGSFHNIGALLIVSGIIGWYIWKYTPIRFLDAAFCAGVGFASHLAEDALVNGTRYHFYIPFSDRGWYQGYIIHPSNDIVFAHTLIASVNLVYIGLALVMITILARCILNGYTWLEKYNPTKYTHIKTCEVLGERTEESVIYGNC